METSEQTITNTNPKRFFDVAEQFIKGMREFEICFAYEGFITQQITLAFSALTESSISRADDTGLIQRRVNFVVIECLQNIIKHAEDAKIAIPDAASKGLFMVSKSLLEYAITTGNVIEKSKSVSLKLKIDAINNLNKEELNAMYMKQISEGELSEVGGAGLGFIDIRRRTGRKLDCYFMDLDDKTSFFILTTFVSRS